jgi:hypothetical protein
VQALPLAQHQYVNANSTDSWRKTIRTFHEQSDNYTGEPDPESPEPAPETAPAPTPEAASDASPASEQASIHTSR